MYIIFCVLFHDGPEKLRVVRGGALAADQVFGRDSELSSLIRLLETDSVLLLAERRTGKTSLLTLFVAQAPKDWRVFKLSVESVASPEEFARRDASWSPVNDIAPLDLGPLSADDARALARALLENEGVSCSEVVEVANVVAEQTNGVPFYIHEVVGRLQQQAKRPVSPADAIAVVRALIDDPGDPLDLRHFEQRLSDYYGERSTLAAGILDAIASAKELGFKALVSKLSSIAIADEGNLRALLEDLQRDHYLIRNGSTFRFRLEVIRRAWVSMRYLDE
jgi:hypothetical protein